MLRSRLFWKLFLGFTAVNLLSAVALVMVTSQWRAENARERLRQELESEAALLAELAPAWVADPAASGAEADLERLATTIGADVELTGPGGKSLAKGGGDRAPRDAATTTLIHSVNDADGERIGSLRVSRRATQLGGDASSLLKLYGVYALIAGLLMLAIGYSLVTHMVAPVRSLNRAAVAMAGGDYDHRAFVSNRDELGDLAKTFNRMTQELGDRLSDLRESDRQQATVLGGMIEGVIAVDDQQRVLFANRAAGKLFGFLPPQVADRPLIEVVRNRPLHEAATGALETRRPQRLDIEWEGSNLSVQVTPLPGEPLAGAVIVLHDTTELRRLESLRRDFVANVSHELKTPLSSIKAYTETLLGAGADDPEFRVQSLHRIEEQADRLERLIADMLSLARIESAQQPFDIQAVRVSTAVDSCLRAYQPQADAKQIALTPDAFGVPSEDRVEVRVDPEALRVILNNLVDNAIKYTPPGGEVRIGWRPDGGSRGDGGAGAKAAGDKGDAAPGDVGSLVRIEVADTGVGIPGEKVDRVFERFYRVDEARSADAGGAGLGLSIVKHLAQSFGGSVSVESHPDAGTTFSVTLPAA